MRTKFLNDFLIDIANFKVSKIETFNYFEELTDNFKLAKVRMLIDDLNNFEVYLVTEDPDVIPYELEDIPGRLIDPLIELLVDQVSNGNEYDVAELELLIEEEEVNRKDSELVDMELSKPSCIEKIVTFNELGILKLMKDNLNISHLKISKILAELTEEKVATIQPVLNSILNQNFSKNNPYYGSSSKSLKNVRQRFANLDIELEIKKPFKVSL